MLKGYDHSKIEKKWQNKWEKSKLFQAKDPGKTRQKKFYPLIEFPFPSGDGLHVGHPRPYIGMDVIARKRRMEGYNVLYPIGWDAFGLPTENYAIKTGLPPEVVTKKNTDNFRRQIKSLGVSFDWSREINTTDPKYYKWTQWIFLQLLKHDLAYKSRTLVNWCPKDKTGLANEEVIDGCCERCGTPVEKREKEQWLLRITKYADRLDKDLDTVDYLEKIKIQQRNWIGKSEGAEIDFEVWRTNEKIKVFTTRPDTIFGATYLVLAPEHDLVKKLWSQIENKEEILNYIGEVKNKTEIERMKEDREKTGIKIIGISAVNPATKEVVPVFVADYVLSTYGTGAIMAVPAHDERDFDFAKKYNLPLRSVVIPNRVDHRNPHVNGKKIIFRNAVLAVVRNPKDGKYLCLKWSKHPWTTFIMGGIDPGEGPIEAAKREVLEETGYKNLKLVRLLGGPTQSNFFAAHKDENRVAQTQSVLFELINEEKNQVSIEELQNHEVVWLSPEEVTPHTMTHIETDIILDRIKNGDKPYTENGVLINSDKFSGLTSEKAKREITKFIKGKIVTKYKLRDWVFSRQRYWGEPIPVIHCVKCGVVPVPEKQLPVKLPKVKKYQPRDDGESPLAAVKDWVNVKCPKCKSPAKRETDTMPNWAGSSWYYLRYLDTKNSKALADKKKIKYWMPVDWYNGGMEHTTLHLLYSRFWHKFLYDIKVVNTIEPYQKRTSHGLILAKNGEKMSKSKGNVINPDEITKSFGADTLRLYEMFMGPFSEPIPWSEDNMIGVRRFIERFWRLHSKVKLRVKTGDKIEIILNKTIKKVTEDIESMAFNTAISAMMILLNELEKLDEVGTKEYETFLKILSPFAPHVVEELWSEMGHKKSIMLEKWPKFDPTKLQEAEVKIAVQVNSKVRAVCTVPLGITEEEMVKIARADARVEKWLLGKEIKKTIYIPNKILNFVV